MPKNPPAYDRMYRARRRAAGNPVPSGSTTWDNTKRDKWLSTYWAKPENRARRVVNQSKSAKRHPDRVTARRKVRHEITMGRMVRGLCEVCKSTHTQAHHDDYSKPLDVRWLCRSHHDAFHKAKAQGGAK